MGKKIPRGMRNCNPLNIRRNGTDKWLGLKPVQEDPSFFQFVNVFYGLRAAFRTIHTYNEKHKLYTVCQIISRWAPPNENNTENYISTVCKISELRRDEYVTVAKEKDKALRLVKAMAYIESTVIFDDETLALGYSLAFGG